MAGRKPDYDVSALDKTTERRGRIGSAWKNDDGSISVQLNPFIVLQGDLAIRLFPAKGDRAKDQPTEPEDIPF